MIIELERFVEFKDEWFGGIRTRDAMTFETMSINTDYVAWLRRWSGPPQFEFCEVHMGQIGAATSRFPCLTRT